MRLFLILQFLVFTAFANWQNSDIFDTVYTLHQNTTKKLPFIDDTIMEEPEKFMNPPGYAKTIKNEQKRYLRSNTDVDVLILYTKALKDKYTSDTETMIQNIFDTAHDAYINSDTQVNLNLIHLQQLPADSILNDDSDILALYYNLKADGYAAYLRRIYHADLIVVVGAYDSQAACGISTTPYNSSSKMTNVYATVLIKPSSESGTGCSDLTLAHELGHNFSCNHDRDHTQNDTNGNAMYDYGFGYDTDSFATIMSYDQPEIEYFSNPSLTYDGDAIGVVDSEDNARVIRNTREEIANNSQEIDESLEEDDNISNLYIDAQLSSNTDRDGYADIHLSGNTTFEANNEGYSHWYFFISLYNDKHDLVAQFDGCDDNGENCQNSISVNIPSAKYRVVVSKSGVKYTWNGDSTDYDIKITRSTNPSLIMYLLN